MCVPNRKAGLLRLLLAVLIVLNMAMIFLFSAESGQQSSQTSGRVTHTVAEVTVPNFNKKPESEQKTIEKKMELPIRKLAHMTEFAALGALTFLFLLTWRGKVLLRYGGAVAFAAVYAVTDELHQNFSQNRGPQATDVLIDAAGAFIACSILLLLWFFAHTHRKKMIVTTYRVLCPKLPRPVRLAVCADLHGTPHDRVIDLLRAEKPDAILIPGDLTDYEGILADDPAVTDFLRACASLAPTYYSLGNHENGCYRHGNPFRKPKKRPIPLDFGDRVSKTGAVLLRNSSVRWGDLLICGLDSGLDGTTNAPDGAALEAFAAAPGVRVLLCHHPEYFIPYLQKHDFDLVVCGHAHGGHWRFFGRGVWAPDQGLFPKYTSGVVGGRCVISRGLGDHTRIPRLFNPRELVMVEFGGARDDRPTE